MQSMTAPTQKTKTQDFIAEISKLKCSESLNFTSYYLPPNIDLQVGRKLSYRLSRYFPQVVVIWQEGRFYVLAHRVGTIPSLGEWDSALKNVQNDLGIENNLGKLSQIKETKLTSVIIARLAQEILNVQRPFSTTEKYRDKNAKVVRQATVGYEIIQRGDLDYPALTITNRSPIISIENLADFTKNHPYRQHLEQLLINLEVQTLDTNSTATIVEIVGPIVEHRSALIAKATGAISRQALESAPDEQPVVAVKFGNRGDKFHYALAALCPHITAKTADQLELDWGKLIAATKIGYPERQQLLTKHKSEANRSLLPYGIKLDKSICSRGDNGRDLFWQLSEPLEQTKLLFGQGRIYPHGNILKGLSEGGIYRRSKDFSQEIPIFIAQVDLIQSNVSGNRFMSEVERQLKRFRCKFSRLNPDEPKLNIEHLDNPSGRAELDRKLEELLIIKPDLVFIFLPQSDRERDEDDNGSLYHRIYAKLLKRGIATQFIYEKNLRAVNATSYVLNQVMPGLLGKLGHIPFVLAEPLVIADVFVGLDVARKNKSRLSGTMIACAGVCFYGKQGEFLRAQSEDAIIEGEEIPARFLEALLPAGELKGKTVAIYRDGRFCGNEAQCLADWAVAIEAKFILIECCKSGCPRLYNLLGTESPYIQAPDRGVALKLSDREAIVVTTKVEQKIGVPRPIRLKIRPEGHQVSIDDVLETTLKLTLLHYGSLKSPKLPVMLHGADRIAGLRLRGVSLSKMHRQPWL
jgi:Piwi domain